MQADIRRVPPGLDRRNEDVADEKRSAQDKLTGCMAKTKPRKPSSAK
jgi:hypothetical protein